jgi:hypothetical protein
MNTVTMVSTGSGTVYPCMKGHGGDGDGIITVILDEIKITCKRQENFPYEDIEDPTYEWGGLAIKVSDDYYIDGEDLSVEERKRIVAAVIAEFNAHKEDPDGAVMWDKGHTYDETWEVLDWPDDQAYENYIDRKLEEKK